MSAQPDEFQLRQLQELARWANSEDFKLQLRTGLRNFQLLGMAFQRLVDAAPNISQFLERLRTELFRVIGVVKSIDWDFLVESASGKKTLSAGWIPHITTVRHVSTLGTNATSDEVRDSIGLFCKDNWTLIKSQLLEDIELQIINDDSKSTFLEAIEMHEQGFYRGVVRTLFVETELIVRRSLGLKTGSSGAIHKFVERLNSSTLAAVMEPGSGAAGLFLILASHLYCRVDDDQEIARLANHGIPNRNAALHGLIPYCSAQNSLNCLFLFSVVTKWLTSLESVKVNTRDSVPNPSSAKRGEGGARLARRVGV